MGETPIPYRTNIKLWQVKTIDSMRDNTPLCDRAVYRYRIKRGEVVT